MKNVKGRLFLPGQIPKLNLKQIESREPPQFHFNIKNSYA